MRCTEEQTEASGKTIHTGISYIPPKTPDWHFVNTTENPRILVYTETLQTFEETEKFTKSIHEYKIYMWTRGYKEYFVTTFGIATVYKIL